jgi:hypothetical protein
MKCFFLPVLLLFSLGAYSQNVQKIVFDPGDSVTGYYLAIPPSSGTIRGVVVVVCPFRGPESILPETRLHNIAAASELLTVYASTGLRLLPDSAAMRRMDRLLADVISKFSVDTSRIALGGFDLAGASVLRYAELARERPAAWVVHPGVVFGIAAPVDMIGYYHRCERQVRKNYFPPVVGDSKFILDRWTREQGSLAEHPDRYALVTPFNAASSEPGNERWLRNVAVRLYYDTDIEWQLKTRRNGYYDTDLPDGSELVDRLLLEGNKRAEFVASRLPGVRSNGQRHTSAYSIVDETDCILWIIRSLHIFIPSNPMAFSGPYNFTAPGGWAVERSVFPPPFAPDVRLRGVEEIRFMPGWGVAGAYDYWSLAYLFWLDAGQRVDGAVLKEMIATYYDGLIVNGGGGGPRSIPKEKIFPTRVGIQRVKAEDDDVETWTGTVDMLDYKILQPMRLYFTAHRKACEDRRHFPVFLELSQRPLGDPIWGELKGPKRGFSCAEE